VGLTSPNSTRNHLHKLAEEGYVRLDAKKARAIALVDPAPDGWTREQ
jgi:SOS-response transcriptional repressor LexA